MANQHKLFGAYDIRGIYGDALNEEFAEKIGHAFGIYVMSTVDNASSAKVLVGFDARVSSDSLSKAFMKGLSETGCLISNAGLTSTPMAVWYAAHHEFDGCAVITASHLSAPYNGFKLYGRKAQPLGLKNGLGEIKKSYEENQVYKGQQQSVATDLRIVDSYLDHLLSHLKLDRPIKIAIDAGHGAAGPELKVLQQRIQGKYPLDLILLNTDPDGTFPTRTPNPLDPGSIDALTRAVIDNKCDLGVSFDGDADRAIFVDEHGALVDTDVIIGLIGAEMIDRNGGGKVVYDLRASRAVPEYISKKGGEAIRTGVGTHFMMGGIKDSGAVFAGELSGHYYYGDMYGTDSAMRTVIEVISSLSQSKCGFSELIAPLKIYASSGEINLRVGSIPETLSKLESAITGGAAEHIDGLSINFEDWWFSARGSQTEPLLRLTIGAVSPDVMEQRKVQLIQLIAPVTQ